MGLRCDVGLDTISGQLPNTVPNLVVAKRRLDVHRESSAFRLGGVTDVDMLYLLWL